MDHYTAIKIHLHEVYNMKKKNSICYNVKRQSTKT